VDDQDRVALSLLESPTAGFTIFDLRSYWRPRRGVLLVAGVENLFDKTYREHLDFRSDDPRSLPTLQPGANFYVGGELTY
jgi:outer membrane receptor protein involved in Fe transport